MAAQRPDRHNWSGARLPTGRNLLVVECFRCAEAGEVDPERSKLNRRRRLFPVRISREGTTLGTTLLCGDCIGGLQPLDPDPLDVTASA